MLSLYNFCPTKEVNIRTIGLDCINCWLMEVAGKCLPLSIAVGQQQRQQCIGRAAGADNGHTLVAASGSSGGDGGVGSGQFPFLLFFCYLCCWSIYLASVEFYSRNTNKASISLFPLSQGISPRQRDILGQGNINRYGNCSSFVVLSQLIPEMGLFLDLAAMSFKKKHF